MSEAMNIDGATNNDYSEERWAPPVKSSATPVDRDLSMHRIGRAFAERMVLRGGYGHPVTQEEVELAWEAFSKADFGFGWRDDERELDSESVVGAETWTNKALELFERTMKMEGDIDFDSKEMQVPLPKACARWRLVSLRDEVIRRLAILCFEDPNTGRFANAVVVVDALFGPAVHGPLPEGDSPTVKGASIGTLRHPALRGGALGTEQKTAREIAEYLLDRGVDPIIVETLVYSWERHRDPFCAGIHAVHLMMVEIVKGREEESPA